MPQQESGDSALIWSPREMIEASPLGSNSMSTVMEVVLSDGGHASTIPPGGEKIYIC